MNWLRGLTKASLLAGIVLLGLSVSGAQAATVTAFNQGTSATAAADWATAAVAGGAITPAPLANAGPPAVGVVLNAPAPFGSITFGNSVFGPPLGIGNCNTCALPGSISGGVYHDRANDFQQGPKPTLNFDGFGVTAFGANWDFGPNQPGTGIQLFVTFVDGSTTSLTAAQQKIRNPNSTTPFVGFYGIVSDMAIRSIRLDEDFLTLNPAQFYETFDMSNLQFVSAVPIPAALPLFLSAIAALGFLGRRKMKAAAA